MTTFTQDLLTTGITTIKNPSENPEQVEALNKVCEELKAQGHTIQLSESYREGKLINVAAHHYRTCNVCSEAGKNRPPRGNIRLGGEPGKSSPIGKGGGS